MSILLRVEKLTKIFTAGGIFGSKMRVVAVNGISFECREGEILGIIGESGSGKTTTMKTILKLYKPTRGKIYFRGRDIWTIPNKEYYRHVQGVFQDPYSSINPVYRVRHLFDNIFDNLLEDVSLDERHEILSEVLDRVQLKAEEVLYKYSYELSGGQLQRVLLAACLLVDPELIIADEPTSMIDASMRVTILNVMRSLREEEGKSIIFITHDIGQAFYICDRLLVMRKGKIVEEGSAEEVVFHPQHPYTKRLIADVPKLGKKLILRR
ncbi:MAG: ABC transporter ATP-binding protein [Thermoprotei archaeon]|nr:MAG: ABC transporter ATP-binding protein [Thermoprotei archaeon]RLE96752.1 MAG: ABC transporter ATP-binding protein [Thermoprotei archaeon]